MKKRVFVARDNAGRRHVCIFKTRPTKTKGTWGNAKWHILTDIGKFGLRPGQCREFWITDKEPKP